MMSSSESLTEEVETADDTDTYSEDFESSAHGLSSRQGPTAYSDDFEASQTSLRYSDDFESTAFTNTPRVPHISQSNGTPRTRPTPRPRKSINTSLTRSYSEDFEPLTGRSVGAGTPTMLDVQTARSGYSVTYTDDWEQYSRSPRRMVRQRSMERMKSMELLTERSALSTGYSDDFETVTQTAKTPRYGTRYSTDTLYSYTESFESAEEITSSEAEEVVSGTESTESFRRQDVSSGEAITVTERTVSDSDLSSSYTYTDATTEDESDSRYDDRAAEAAQRQFIMHKLSVLLDSSNKTPRDTAPSPKVAAPDRNTATFCRKKVRLLKKKLKDKSSDVFQENIPEVTPRRQLTEEDTSNVEDLGISSSVINRLRTENSLERLKKLANEEIHEPAKCPNCREQVEAMALREYAHRKKVLVEAKLIEDRIENNQYLYGDVVAMMGQGVAELPSINDNRKEIFKRLLKPWSTELWGSKELKEEEENANKENTSLSSSDLTQQNKPELTLTCPYLANFDSEESEEPIKDSLFKPRNIGAPLFNDEDEISQTDQPKQTFNSVFDIYATKLESLGIFNDESDRVSTYRPDRGTFPEGPHWEEVRSRLDSCVEAEPRTPIATTQEVVPIGLDVPTDRQQFWKQYFAPLKTCHWFPNGDKI